MLTIGIFGAAVLFEELIEWPILYRIFSPLVHDSAFGWELELINTTEIGISRGPGS